MKIKSVLLAIKNKVSSISKVDTRGKKYIKRYKKYSFYGSKCDSKQQYEGSITRWYHTIEKGLAYTDYRAGFGESNINALLSSMENYVKDGYSKDEFFFQTALSTLDAYITKNKEYGVINDALEKRVNDLKGTKNYWGGVLRFNPLSSDEIKTADYETFITSRHSMRHFSSEPVDLRLVEEAVALAQHTPSACNRQGWRTIIVQDKAVLQKVLANQNGNRGFGQEFDKVLLVVADIRYFNRDRELFQPYIDGGMYAQSILNALHYKHIASCPLSASLHEEQEENIRKILSLEDAEVPIIIIGIGNYPEGECQTTRSERRQANIQVF